MRKAVLLVFLLLVPLLASSSVPVKAQDEWIIVERGANFVRKQNVANPSLFSWESAPQWILNPATGEYAPYIYWRDEAKKCHVVRSALIAAEIFWDTGIAKFYDPSLVEERVKSEAWQLWQWDGSNWKLATLSSTINFEVTQNATGVYIEATRSTSKPTGILTVIYHFRIGQSMKHWVYWENLEALDQTVEIHQVWDLAGSVTKCAVDNVATDLSGTYDATRFLFFNETSSFLVLEDQSAMFEKLKPTTIDFSGKKVIYIFSNWTLVQGEALEIDPATATLNNPTEDGYIEYYVNEETYTRYASATKLWMGTGLIGEDLWTYRSYVEWDIASIPDSATIIDTIFKYTGSVNNIDCHIYEMVGTRPSTSGDQAVYDEAGEGTKYYAPDNFPVAGYNKEANLGTTADADLQSQLTSDWFAIGIQSEDEGLFTYSIIYSEEHGDANPKPTLYVEYDSAPPTFSEITANTTIANKPVTLSVTIDDLLGVSHYIWSWNNTGSMVNGTTTAWTSNPVTFDGTWNETVGNVVSVLVYANDTADRWAESTTYNFTLVNYHAYFTYLPASPTQGDSVDITVHVQKAGDPFTNYVLNVTRQGVLWQMNVTTTNSTFEDSSNDPTSRTYNVSALYDTDLPDFVPYSVTPATIKWTEIGSPSNGGPPPATAYAVSIRVVKGTAPVPSVTVILADISKITDSQGYAIFSVAEGTHALKVIQDGATVYSNQLQVTEDGVWQVDLNQPDQPPQDITPERGILPEIPSEIAQLGIVVIVAVVLVAFVATQSGKKSSPEREWRSKGKNIKRGKQWKK